MGRHERPLDPDAGPVQAFAAGLRELRRQAGNPTYQTLARITYCSKSALSAAASGNDLPTLAVTLAYVRACGGDAEAWEARWHELSSRLAADRASPPVRKAGPAAPDDLLLEQLAAAVAAQWAGEAEVRGLNHPVPLAVRWSAADPAMMDRLAVVTGGRGPGRAGGGGGGLERLSGRLDEVADAFERLPSRRLVILGTPGAGKTVLAIQLVRQLLARRERGQPVPVLLPVGSWNPHSEHLHTWIAARLAETYPALRFSKLAAPPARTGRIIPILDGLDEMPRDLRAAALRGINRALAHTEPLVLTCRVEEYRDTIAGAPAVEPLAAAAVVELRPLRPADVETYLLHATPMSDAAKWTPVFGRLREDPEGPLARALSTPLMAALARVAYGETTADPAALLDGGLRDRGGIEDHLMDRLIPSVYTDRPRPDGEPGRWTAEQAQRWLRFLARHLHRLGTRDLAWWQLHHAVRANPFGALFAVLSGLVVAAGLGLVGAIKGGMEHGLAGGVKDATFGLMFALASGFAVRASPMTRRLAYGALGGIAGGIAYAAATIDHDGVIDGIIFGLSDGAAVGVAVGLTAALAHDTVPGSARIRLRMGAHRLARPMIAGLAFGVCMGVLGGIVIESAVGVLGGLAVGLATGAGISVRYMFGGPTDIAQASSPTSVWRADRAAALAHGIVVGLIGGLILGPVAAVVTSPAVGIEFALMFGMVYAFAVACFTAWYRLLVARVYLSLAGRLPWRLMPFLADAHQRGVLRQVGAVYQFRHARLQDRLASTDVE